MVVTVEEVLVVQVEVDTEKLLQEEELQVQEILLLLILLKVKMEVLLQHLLLKVLEVVEQLALEVMHQVD